MTFESLGLSEIVLKAVRQSGYQTATPIQAESIPHLLAGRDLLGSAQTGTGKTAAFALPILHRMHAATKSHAPHAKRKIRVLVLSPTRELATQIGESFTTYGAGMGFKQLVLFGGVGYQPQTRALRSGVDLLIATPGRLLDLMGQGVVNLTGLETFVLDEADRMLDMGFLPDIRRVIEALPVKRQNIMFSATFPKEIAELSSTILREPAEVRIQPESKTADLIDQAVCFIPRQAKLKVLSSLLRMDTVTRTIVFTRTKHGADRVVDKLAKVGVRAEAIHGNKTQNARQKALDSFRTGRATVLVATDVAARGIDVDNISHVVNYDLPSEPETYVHRIGRTARGGASGTAITLCDHDERKYLKLIERLLGNQLPTCKIEMTPDPVDADLPADEAPSYSDRGDRKRPRPDRRRRGEEAVVEATDDSEPQERTPSRGGPSYARPGIGRRRYGNRGRTGRRPDTRSSTERPAAEGSAQPAEGTPRPQRPARPGASRGNHTRGEQRVERGSAGHTGGSTSARPAGNRPHAERGDKPVSHSRKPASGGAPQGGTGQHGSSGRPARPFGRKNTHRRKTGQ